jgi:hypothetical protein
VSKQVRVRRPTLGHRNEAASPKECAKGSMVRDAVWRVDQNSWKGMGWLENRGNANNSDELDTRVKNSHLPCTVLSGCPMAVFGCCVSPCVSRRGRALLCRHGRTTRPAPCRCNYDAIRNSRSSKRTNCWQGRLGTSMHVNWCEEPRAVDRDPKRGQHRTCGATLLRTRSLPAVAVAYCTAPVPTTPRRGSARSSRCSLGIRRKRGGMSCGGVPIVRRCHGTCRSPTRYMGLTDCK